MAIAAAEIDQINTAHLSPAAAERFTGSLT